MERLDKILANAKIGSRKEVRELIKKKRIALDGQILTDPCEKFDPDSVALTLDGEPLRLSKFIYVLLNKPAGYLSATEDQRDPVVVDLLDESYRPFNPFPVGRLDKDTTGLLLLTNDGELNHRLISPRWHVDKEYRAQLDHAVGPEQVAAFAQGVTLEDGTKTLPARLFPEEGTSARVILQEGKFHQVKRMFEAVDNKVLALERIAFANLRIEDAPPQGQCRELTSLELKGLKDLVLEK